MTVIARPIPTLSAEQAVLLHLCTLALRPVSPRELERAVGPRGLRFSVGPALEFLEDQKLVERERPAPARPMYVASEDGIEVLEQSRDAKYRKRVLAELDARIKKFSEPHPRDKSVAGEDAWGYLAHVRALLLGEEAFINARGGFEVDAGSPVEVSDGAVAGLDDEPENDEEQEEDDERESVRTRPRIIGKPKKGSAADRRRNPEIMREQKPVPRKPGSQSLRPPLPEDRRGNRGTRKAPPKAAGNEAPAPLRRNTPQRERPAPVSGAAFASSH